MRSGDYTSALERIVRDQGRYCTNPFATCVALVHFDGRHESLDDVVKLPSQYTTFYEFYSVKSCRHEVVESIVKWIEQQQT